jgi:hypothetical protein
LTIAIAVLLVFLIGPLWLSGAGARYAAREPGHARPLPAPWDWRKTFCSTLLYTLGFNLTFLLQELFLVLPKALTPGLQPTLFHNNHSWQGHNPVAALFQGTGAVAILISSVVCMLLLKHPWRSATARLFLVWMAYSGAFMALPQMVIGAVSPQSDVGMAMSFLQLGAVARTMVALLALALLPVAGWHLAGEFLAMESDPAGLGSVRARRRLILQLATAPALLAVPLIVLFRVPRELIEVVAVPAVVSVAGMVWVQASAWRPAPQGWSCATRTPLAYPLAAVVLLLLVFQLILRRGIGFY